MNSKFYVSLEAARLLKEKGYNEECDYCFYYDDYNDKWDFDYPHNLFDDEPMHYNNETIDDEMYSMPTKAEAIDWLESKGIVISVEYINGLWDCQIYSFVDGTILHGKALPMVYDVVNFPTRLQAEEAAIIKSLTLLN